MDMKYLLPTIIIIVIPLHIFIILFLHKRKKNRPILKTDNQLKAELNEAIEVNLQRTEFFSNMTHELKTPLSIILGAIQITEKNMSKELNENRFLKKNLNVIKFNCYRMLRLTNNLLDLTKIEAGYLSLRPVNCDLCLLLEAIIDSVKPYALQQQLDLVYNSPPEPLFASVDIEKFDRIALNLLSNAIKFTKPGGIITTSVYPSEHSIHISVKDTGIGIPLEKQEEIFERFMQSGNNTFEENVGCGLGLSLVLSFVQLHGGSVRIISAPGKGSEFIVDLPKAREIEHHIDSKYADFNYHLKEAAKIEFSILHPTA